MEVEEVGDRPRGFARGSNRDSMVMSQGRSMARIKRTKAEENNIATKYHCRQSRMAS